MRLNTFFKDEQDKFELRVALKAIARKAIFNTLVYEGFDKDCEVSVTFTDNEQIKEDFNELYRLMNGMELREMDRIIYPVCRLCRDHERSGFIEGIKVGVLLQAELTEE